MSPKDMKRFVLDDVEDHVSDAAAVNGTRVVPAGAVFIVVRGMILAHTFPVCVAGRTMAFNQDVKAIVPNGSADGRFVAHWLHGRSDVLLGMVTEATHGTKRLEQSELQAFPLDLPPPVEQRLIAEILDTVGDAIRTTELIIAKLRQIKQALLYDLLTRGIDSNGELRDPVREGEKFKDSSMGRIPTDWEVLALGVPVPRAVYGISSSLGQGPGIPVLRMNNLKGGEADISDLKYSARPEARDLVLRSGDVLFNRTNSIDHVGRTGIWRGQLDVASFASYLVRLEPDPSRIDSEFLNRWLNWERTQVAIRQFATPGVHQVNINPTNLRRTPIALPGSVDEQRSIADRLAGHDERLASEQRTLEKLRLVKAGLVEDLLTGSVRVTAFTERVVA